jgi:UDP-N-acetyl-D-glucosamine dehydrogenase
MPSVDPPFECGETLTPFKGSVVVVGQGYVGLPLAMRAVEVGYRVVGYDTDINRIKLLTAGESYVEDVRSSALGEALDSERYRPSVDPTDCAGFDVAVITVPTPLTDFAPDLSNIEDAGRTLGPYVRPGSCVVLESTTYPGTTEEFLGPILEALSGLKAGADFDLGYSPERIDPGNREWTLANTPKVVSGVSPASLVAVRTFYDSLVERTVTVSGTAAAELSKLLENTFRHVNIALMNELAMAAGDLGLSIWESLDAASTKPFGFMRFEPGPGVGGHCLPIDPTYLSWLVRRQSGTPSAFVEHANNINHRMPAYVVQRLSLALNRDRKSLRGSRILLLGLSYKADTGDVRGSPAVAVAEGLVELGVRVRAADPYAPAEFLADRVARVELDEDELAAADAVVLLTPHTSFDYELVVRHARYIFDTRHRITAPQAEYL